MTPPRKNLPIALYLLLVFACGSIVGALGYRTYNPPTVRTVNPLPSPSEWRRQYMEESKTRLNLTDDQYSKLGAILDQTDDRFRQARDRENEEIRQIKDEHFARVRAILNPDQVAKYEKLRAEREARRLKDPNRR